METKLMEVSITYKDKIRDLLGPKIKIINHPDNVLLPSFPSSYGYLIQEKWAWEIILILALSPPV